MNKSTELNTTIVYSNIAEEYFVYDADTEEHLFSATTLQDAWDEIKDECERRESIMGDCVYNERGPDMWDDINR